MPFYSTRLFSSVTSVLLLLSVPFCVSASLEQLQHEKESLESESSMYSSEIEKLQHKLQIMSEMYQENELKLHR